MFAKKAPLFYTISLLFLILFVNSFAQKTTISSEPLWMLILPGRYLHDPPPQVQNLITDIVVDIAWESGRFEVFDRFDVREVLRKHHLLPFGYLPDSVVLAVGDYTKCDEALIVDVVSFSQIGVPSSNDDEEEEDRNFLESIIDGLFSSDSEDYSNNIHTHLSVQFRNIDLITGKEIDRFSVRVSHTGGTKPESEEKTLEKFREVVFNEVRLLYQLVSEVIAVDGVDLDLLLGSNLGLSGNTLFEIIEPDRIKIVDNENVTTPGKSVGLVSVRTVSDTVNRSVIIRQWGAIEPGDYANEFNNRIQGIQIYFLPAFPDNYLYIGGQYHFSPLSSWDFGVGMHYLSVTDSYNENDNGLGFSVFGSRKLFTLTALTVYAKLGSNLDIPFKEDDDGNTVSTVLVSGSLGLTCNLMMSKKSDIEINLGYRISSKSSDWTYSEREEELDAFWYDDPPVVDLAGFYFSVGYKFIIF
jgi:hypothetical protein